MFLVSSSDVELTVPPRFALASVMSSSGITTELVTFILAKRAAELDRFELLYLWSNRAVHYTLLNTERAYKRRLSGKARQSQIGILCFDWLIHPGVSYSREIRTK